MAEINTLEITKAGMEASITNSPNRNGFKIEINKVDIISNGVRKSQADCYGVGSLNNVITITAEIDEPEISYPITQLNFYDGISGKIFAIAKPPTDGIIDMVFSGKKTFICLTMGFMIMPENTVTVSTAVTNFLELHKSSADVHKNLFNLYVNKTELQNNPDLNYNVLDSKKPLTAKYLADIYTDAVSFRDGSNSPTMTWVDKNKYGGYVVEFVDGLVHESINLKNVNTSDRTLFIQQRNSIILDVPLLVPLSNIFSVDIYLYEMTLAGYSDKSREAEEWRTSWAATASTNEMVRVNLRRWSGTWSVQNINIRVVVKGLK